MMTNHVPIQKENATIVVVTMECARQVLILDVSLL